MLERVQATTEVLRMVSRSPQDLNASLQAVADAAVRLCNAQVSRVMLRDGDYLTIGPSARLGGAEEVRQPGRRVAMMGSKAPASHAVLTAKTVHTEHITGYMRSHGATDAEIEFIGPTPLSVVLAVPLLRGDEAVGALLFVRGRDTGAFSEREIALAETVADQAAIAVENARLFQGIQDRNGELTEALEQQTATADVLRIISEAPADLQRVLDTLLDNAARLCHAPWGALFGREGRIHAGDVLHVEATFSSDASMPTPLDVPISQGTITGRAILDAAVVTHFGGLEERLREFPDTPGRMPGVAARIAVPLLREGAAVGAFFIQRTESGPFTEREIALLRTFADQAVIAMENARLFEELQERNREQAETLEREQATAEVLRIISRSPEDLDTSLQAVADTVARFCGADFARVFLLSGDELVAGPTSLAGRAQHRQEATISVGRIGELGRYAPAEVIRTGQRLHFDDLQAYLENLSEAERERIGRAVRDMDPAVMGVRTSLWVPLLRGNLAVGALGLARFTVRPYDEQEIALAETFADQAAIAVENARLFQCIQERNRELTEALAQQTTTADVLRAISRSPVELRPVLETLAESAARLCDAADTTFFIVQGETIHRGAYYNFVEADPIPRPQGRALGPGWLPDRAALEQRPLQFVGEFTQLRDEFPETFEFTQRQSWERGSILAVPLLRKGEAVGVLRLHRTESRPFSEKQIALVETFADQAVIAMENARLFDELQVRTQELEAASRAKSEFLSRMSHELRTPLNAIIGFAEIMEMDPNTTPRQLDRAHHILQGGRHLLGLINEVLDITRIEAGRLSLSLESVQLDDIVQEVLDLERPLTAEAGVRLDLDNPDTFRVAVQADRQRLRQIVLNLVANAVKYNRRGGSVLLRVDVVQRTRVGEPVSESADPAFVRLSVQDTGPGIPEDQLGRLFAPFERLSAELTGVEGTGLGLAIVRGLTEAMGGIIGVESAVGEGSTFWVELPRAELPIAGVDAAGLLSSALQESDGSPQLSATVLYIEDNQPNVDLVQEALRFRPGITLLTAPDGATGIRIARRYRPSLILLDLNLPELQGDEVLARLRADDRTSAIPVIMVSADATQGQIDRLLAAGACDYLTKPLDVKRLLAIVDEILAAASASSAAAQSDDFGPADA
jgi:signal transduction histidine kinase/CheY-like chemotaxis protein